MSYNYTKEYLKWKNNKEKENKLLQDLGVDEEIIQKINQYDWEEFKRDRRLRSKQIPTMESFFDVYASYDRTTWNSVEDMMNDIEDKALYDCLSNVDKQTLEIILLKTKGYSTKDISLFLNMTSSAIYSRIKRLKKKIKKSINNSD